MTRGTVRRAGNQVVNKPRVLFGVLLAGIAVGGYGGSSALAATATSYRPLSQDGGGDMNRQNSSIVSDGQTTRIVVTVDGKTCRKEVPGHGVSVRTVTVNSQAYIEVTDKDGTTRRYTCE